MAPIRGLMSRRWRNMNVRTKHPTGRAPGTPCNRGDVDAAVSDVPGGSLTGLKELTATARSTFASIGVAAMSSSELNAAMKHVNELRRAAIAFELSLRNRGRELQPSPEPSPLPSPPEQDDAAPPVPDSGVPEDVSQATLDTISGIDCGTGRLRDRMARVLEQMPALARALAGGDVAEAHIERLANEMFRATDAAWAGLIAEQHELAAAAVRMQPVVFGRYVSAALQRITAQTNAPIERDLEAEIRGSYWIDPSTGLGRLTATFSPAAYSQITPLLGFATARLMNATPGIDKNQAIGRAILQLLTEERSDGSASTSAMPPIAVLIDERTLFDGAHEATICERPDGSRVPVDVARQMACDTSLVPILHDTFGVVLDVGRAKRYNTPAQRIAMMSMYATCFHSACDVPITECDGHHITYWDHGGRTDMNNLLPVCRHHHRWIHANEPTITLDDRRVATVVMRNGTTTTHHPDRRPPDRQPPDRNGDRGRVTTSPHG